MQSLEAVYVEKFKCDGGKCNSKCCRNWRIIIDEKTFSKYKRIKPPHKAKEITKHIKKTKLPNGMSGNLIILDKNESCPFICDDLLCHIQRNYGESYLSRICRTYPRVHIPIASDFTLRSLSITCPVACNLVLNQERPVKFHTVELKSDGIITYDVKNNGKIAMAPLFTITAANILQADELTIDQRLAVLLLFAESADGAKDLNALSEISESFEKEVIKNAPALLAPLKFDSKLFLGNMFAFIEALFTGEGQNAEAKVYNKFIDDTFELRPIGDPNRAVNGDETEELYFKRFLPAKEILLRDYSLQIQNYLTHYFLMSGLPFTSGLKNLTGGVAKFVAEYKLAEFVFVAFRFAMGDKFHEIAIELVAQDYANIFEHNLSVKDFMDEKFKNVSEALPVIKLMLNTN